jgi:hypothetical protein
MPEYGRNIQRMVDYLRTIEDPEKRQKNAQAIIELMGVLNPHLKNVEDFRHKLWDHLFLIADFDLDVQSPYPIPTRESLFRKPDPLPYPSRGQQHKHLGKNLSHVLKKALDEQDEEKRRGFAQSIAYYMKLAYNNWHKEAVHDDMIKEELSLLSNGTLEYIPGGARMRFNNNNMNNQHKKRNNNNNNNNNNRGGNRNAGQGAQNRNNNGNRKNNNAKRPK